MAQPNRSRREKPIQAETIQISGFGPITKPIDIPGFGTKEHDHRSQSSASKSEKAKEKPMEAKFLEMQGFGPNTRRIDTSTYGRAFMPWEPVPDGPRTVIFANTLSKSRRKDRDMIMLPYGVASRRVTPLEEDERERRSAREGRVEEPIVAGPSNAGPFNAAGPSTDRTSTAEPSPAREEKEEAEESTAAEEEPTRAEEESTRAKENRRSSLRERIPSIGLPFTLGKKNVPRVDY